ncbi:MAG: hypothetical protein H7039_00690 [Bryobacteraceae bacterium]|nr:hypothetical protein [Bryobacteraceae bacterium]
MNDILLAVLTFFVFLSAVAMCAQAGMLFGIWKTMKQLQGQATSLLPQARSILSKAEATLDENRQSIADFTAKASELATKVNEIAAKATEIAGKATEITGKASEIAGKANELMDSGKAQMAKLDVVVTDASGRARAQLERAELVVDDTVTRIHQSVTAVHNGVVRPIREVQALTAGVKAAVQHLARGGRPSVADARHDEEMFIG